MEITLEEKEIDSQTLSRLMRRGQTDREIVDWLTEKWPQYIAVAKKALDARTPAQKLESSMQELQFDLMMVDVRRKWAVKNIREKRKKGIDRRE